MDFEKRFAEAILEAQKIREKSFDQDAANKVWSNKRRDFEQFYDKTYFGAAEEAAERSGFDLRIPIYLLIKHTWNDIQDWAKEVRAKEVKNEKNN